MRSVGSNTLTVLDTEYTAADSHPGVDADSPTLTTKVESNRRLRHRSHLNSLVSVSILRSIVESAADHVHIERHLGIAGQT
jgi:hypothetical protein